MQANEYELMRDVQSRHWWWLGREQLLRILLKKYLPLDRRLTIADVGSGYGANLPLLAEFGDSIYALETDSACLAHIGVTHPQAKPIKWSAPQPVDQQFDVMLLADVLEHIGDDQAAMQWVHDHLKPGGLAFVTVPAHMHLWSEMDDVVHHHRRYSRPALAGLIGPGLLVERISFYNAVLYPVKIVFVWLTGVLRKLFPAKPKKSYNDLPPSLINHAFKNIMFAEASVLRFCDLPFGVSLIMVIRRV